MPPRHRPPPSSDHFPDVLAAALGRQGWAFELLYAAVAPAVAGYLRVQGAEDPEDLTSEVLFGAFGALDKFCGDERAWRTWVMAIAHRRLVDERRRRSRRVVTVDSSGHGDEPQWEPTSTGAEDQALEAMSTARLQVLCEALAPDQRDVILLRLVADLSVEQVASALGKSPGAVKALQRRGVEALRRRLRTETLPEGVPR